MQRAGWKPIGRWFRQLERRVAGALEHRVAERARAAFIPSKQSPGQRQEHFLDAGAGLGAGFKSGPAVFRDGCVLDFPLIAEIRFIQHQNERQRTELIGDALLQLDCLRERRRAAAVRHQDVSGSAAKMRDLELRQIVFARQVP